MKKRISLFALFAMVALLACSSDDEDSTGALANSGNLLAVGASANDMLSNTSFEKMVIEIAYVSGFRPTAETVANFEAFLRERTFKDAIEFRFQELPSPDETTLTNTEIRALEDENRTAYNNGSTLAIYIYFTDAPSGSDSRSGVVLGSVYRNTSMVIFGPTIRLFAESSASISITDMETATVNHEFGHLFGLVNLGTPLLSNHEDPANRGHCNVEDCLMQGSLSLGGCALSMETLEHNAARGMAIVPTLREACLADLRGNEGR